MQTAQTAPAPFKSKREAMLCLPEVEHTAHAFRYALRLMLALRKGNVTHDQYDLLAGDLQTHCIREKIETISENVSLFTHL